MKRSLLFALLATCLFGWSSSEHTSLAQAAPQTIAFPAGFMPSVVDYGALPDDGIDDTAALQAALNDKRIDESGNSIHDDYFGRPKALYFPPGEYIVRDTLRWVGCCVTLQGSGPSATTIRLVDAAPGFGDPENRKPVITMPAGNRSFRQNIFDLAIDTGRNNPGATGLDWIANNRGAVRNVRITASDGQGVAGLDMTRAWPGPSLVQDLTVEGFDHGIQVRHREYGPTFERITLRNQRLSGIDNEANTLAIRGLTSENAVPAISSRGGPSLVILLDAVLGGGDGSRSAVEFAEGNLYARNVFASGYETAIRQGDAAVDGLTIDEFVSEPVESLFESPLRSLHLPIAETPTFHSEDFSTWAAFEPDYYGDTKGLQALLDSGAETIYFPHTTYFSYNERSVTVPPSVRRIVGFSSVINGDGRGENGGRIKFVIAEASDVPLIIEDFGYGVKVEHGADRPLVLRHLGLSSRYEGRANSGDLFLEDVGTNQLNVAPGQRVWARQLNTETLGNPATKVFNRGGDLWILGIKTEGKGPVIETLDGGRTELLGTLIYPVRDTPPGGDDVAFRNVDSSHSLIFSINTYVESHKYATIIEETRNGETRRVSSGGRFPLHVGYRAGAAPPAETAVPPEPTPGSTSMPTSMPTSPSTPIPTTPATTMPVSTGTPAATTTGTPAATAPPVGTSTQTPGETIPAPLPTFGPDAPRTFLPLVQAEP